METRRAIYVLIINGYRAYYSVNNAKYVNSMLH